MKAASRKRKHGSMPRYVHILAGLIASLSLVFVVFHLAHSGLSETGAHRTPGLDHYHTAANWSTGRAQNATAPTPPPLQHAQSTPAHSSGSTAGSSTGSSKGSTGSRAVADLQSQLLQHPFTRLSASNRSSMSLEDHFSFMQRQPECLHTPIFTSMANVFSDLYWQLIENFIYTMAKFGLLHCTVMVCVSDTKCMHLCGQAGFPCYDFQYETFHEGPLPSALEQIGELKLLHLPKALARGVDLFMLDLDVGFIDSPLSMIQRLGKSNAHVFVQRDISFIMNRTLEGWRTWFTQPQPNIGMMLCRGQPATVRMFAHAWEDYKSIKTPIKHNPGKDQNKVVNAMRYARQRYGLKWQYLPPLENVLLDKIYKFQHQTTYELGGEAAVEVLQGVKAVHTTCYEQKTKVMGLKAANAFWNPLYYDPLRPTLTKPLLLLTDQQLRREVRALLYLALATNRSLILPNVQGNELNDNGVQLFRGRALWPGFRVAFFPKDVDPPDILEPAFYWRINRDYTDGPPGGPGGPGGAGGAGGAGAPPVTVVPLHTLKGGGGLRAVEGLLLSEEFRRAPRLVLQGAPGDLLKETRSGFRVNSRQNLEGWAQDSVGLFAPYEVEVGRYSALPGMGEGKGLARPGVAQGLLHVRLCDQVHSPNLGNRSCFDKCD